MPEPAGSPPAPGTPAGSGSRSIASSVTGCASAHPTPHRQRRQQQHDQSQSVGGIVRQSLRDPSVTLPVAHQPGNDRPHRLLLTLDRFDPLQRKSYRVAR
jgi:hypothetical protein